MMETGKWLPIGFVVCTVVGILCVVGMYLLCSCDAIRLKNQFGLPACYDYVRYIHKLSI